MEPPWGAGEIFQKPLERVLGGLLIIAENLPSGALLVELTDKLLQWQRCIETQWEAVHGGGQWTSSEVSTTGDPHKCQWQDQDE